jgi:hypothetical protein
LFYVVGIGNDAIWFVRLNEAIWDHDLLPHRLN